MLREKTGIVLCISIYDEPAPSFLGAFQETFHYLGIKFGGCLHKNCENGFVLDANINEIGKFIAELR